MIIDFSSARAVDGLLDYCERTGRAVVLCTTGLSEAQILRAEEVSGKAPVLRSANMSLGVNTLLKLLKDAARVLAPAGFDILTRQLLRCDPLFRYSGPLPCDRRRRSGPLKAFDELAPIAAAPAMRRPPERELPRHRKKLVRKKLRRIGSFWRRETVLRTPINSSKLHLASKKGFEKVLPA